MPTFPSTLPQEFSANVKVKENESRATQQMDSGPASVRNRFTAVTENIDTIMTLNGYQLQIFNTFFKEELNNGALSFFWKHPYTDQVCLLRFREKPEWTCVCPSSDVSSRIWQGSLQLETIPSGA